MASSRKSQWKTLPSVRPERRRLRGRAVHPAGADRARGAPRNRTGRESHRERASVQRLGADVNHRGPPGDQRQLPTAQRAREIVYAPDLDGRADPGEIVWTWVVYEDDPTRGKDRPVLVVGRDRGVLLGLMLSSQERYASDPDWVGIGTGDWDAEGRESWVRLDRVLDVPEEGIRREGAVLNREIFDVVATRQRTDYAWR